MAHPRDYCVAAVLVHGRLRTLIGQRAVKRKGTNDNGDAFEDAKHEGPIKGEFGQVGLLLRDHNFEVFAWYNQGVTTTYIQSFQQSGEIVC